MLLTLAQASPYPQLGPPSGNPSHPGPGNGPPSHPGGGPPSNPGGGPPGEEGPLFDIKASSPPYTWLYEYPLPIPKIAQPIYTETVSGQKIEYFEITIEAFDQQIYPNLGPAHLVGYSKFLLD